MNDSIEYQSLNKNNRLHLLNKLSSKDKSMTTDYENIVTLNFEIQTDMNYVMEFITDACRENKINGRVECTQDTLTTSFEHNPD